ncbi:ABC transporter permease [Geomonas terrae]|nr:ABC-2 transporter permease [Geomonas terrae]
MQQRFPIAAATFKGGMRDKFLLGLGIVSLLLVCTMPVFGSFSMRDVTGAATTYGLSLVSAFGVLLVIFIGGTLIPRDIQSRSIYSAVTLPVSRTRYLLEKYLGLAQLLGYSMAALGVVNLGALALMASMYPPDKPLAWGNYLVYLFFDLEKLLVLAAVLIFFASIATSAFLPQVLTVAVYAIGLTTEKVKLYVESAEGAKHISPALKVVVQWLYYICPNLSPFDFKVQMIYALPVDPKIMLLALLYGTGYIVVMLVLASFAFSRRDFV